MQPRTRPGRGHRQTAFDLLPAHGRADLPPRNGARGVGARHFPGLCRPHGEKNE